MKVVGVTACVADDPGSGSTPARKLKDTFQGTLGRIEVLEVLMKEGLKVVVDKHVLNPTCGEQRTEQGPGLVDIDVSPLHRAKVRQDAIAASEIADVDISTVLMAFVRVQASALST